jgi:hypothetical protein
MSNPSTNHGHPLDAELAGTNLFAWFRPAFEVLGRNLLLALAAGVVMLLLAKLLAELPWPPAINSSWGMRTLQAFVSYVVFTAVGLAAYRTLARSEGARYAVDEVTPWARMAVVGIEICVVWTLAAMIVQFGLWLIAKPIGSWLSGHGETGWQMVVFIITYAKYVVAALVFILAPIWMMLGISSSLAQAFAVRSPESGLDAVLSALRLVFGQRARVLGPALIIGAGLGLLILLEFNTDFLPSAIGKPVFIDTLMIVSFAFGIAMTFVIERAYAPDLGLRIADDDVFDPSGSPTANAPLPMSPAGSPSPVAATSSTAASPAAALADVAAIIEGELRNNRTTDLVLLVERGLGADPRFFAARPDYAVALAKRMVQAQRADLALRVLQPYVKEQQQHRLHLTGALLAADLLAGDPQQLPAAARFLAQLKALYPNEPMVDRLIRLTDRAIARGTAGAPQPPAT